MNFRVERTEALMNRPYSRHPPSLHAPKDWWDKSNVTWFFNWQTSGKGCQEINVEFAYSRQQKNEELFISTLKTIMAIDERSDHCFFSACSRDCRCTHDKQYWRKTCRNSNWTFCKIIIVVSFWVNEQITCLPPETPRDITFIPVILNRSLTILLRFYPRRFKLRFS